jgi:large subunit ribosomal protein L24
MRKIKKGDDVIVLTGKDKGKRGTVLSVTDDNRVFVDNVNMVKRHTKANPQRGVAGGIIEKEASVDLSNVALFNPVTKKADRVGFRVLEDGRKVRYFKSNDEVVDI